VVRAYFVLPHATPIVVVLTTTAIITFVANDGVPTAQTFAAILLAMLGGQIAIGAVNELIDAPIDAQVKPSKPIPAGLVTRQGAIGLTLISLAGMVIFAARLGWESFILCLIGTATGIAYSVWFKRTMLAWLPYLIALPLLPIWIFAAVDRFDTGLLMLYPLGIFAVVGVYLSQSLPDIAADRASTIDNLTSRLGESRSLVLILSTQLVSALMGLLAATQWSEVAPVRIAALGVAVLSLIVLGLYRWRPRTGVLACFPCVALSTAILGIAWVIGLT
jgi:4-hydroxybenzoate polyprenyltransferase